jgi:hypothetical protein
MVDHLVKPNFISGLFNARLVSPQLDAMRSLRLEFLQVLAGVVLTRATKVKTLFGGAGRHFTRFAVRVAPVRTAAIAFHLVNRELNAFGKLSQPLRVLVGGNEYAARRAKQAAHRRQVLVGLIEVFRRCHIFSPSASEKPPLFPESADAVHECLTNTRMRAFAIRVFVQYSWIAVRGRFSDASHKAP